VHLERLSLEDFRNYARAAVEFAPGLNLIVGRNAQGKTNLLEAAYCLSGLPSPRALDPVLVRTDTEKALIHADITRGERTVHVDIEIKPGRGRRVQVNRAALPRGRSLGEVLVAVFFGPDELGLIKGSPEGRRRFIDELVVKLRPAREGVRREWERVLKQRNALLRSARSGEGDLEDLVVWDDALCTAGAELAAVRLSALAALRPLAAGRFEAVAGGGAMELGYSSSWLDNDLYAAAMHAPEEIALDDLARSLRSRLGQLRGPELERGVTLAGPQRDDIVVRLAGDAGLIDARTHASQGDQRTGALALKLAEQDLLTDDLGDRPLLLLDDVFSELDPARRSWLAKSVQEMGQTLVTTTALEDLEVAGIQRVFEVDAGQVSLR
jgi:DNA replication and repair protein RecF